MKKCYKCGKEKINNEMFLVHFRKLGIHATYNSRVGFSRYYCDDCLKELNMYEEIKNDKSYNRIKHNTK